jgi:hypothetical protein
MRTFSGGTGDSLALAALVGAALTFTCGLVALTDTRRTTSAGALGVVFAAVSLFTALDLVGFALAAAGGLGCVKWRPGGRDAGESVTVGATPSNQAVASLTLALVVGLSYFGAPLMLPLVTGQTTTTAADVATTQTRTETFPQSSPENVGGFVVFQDGVTGFGYDHLGEGYRNSFETSESDDVAVGELRLTHKDSLLGTPISIPGGRNAPIRIYNLGDTPQTPGDYGFYLYKNYGGGDHGPGPAASIAILADDGRIENNDNVAVGGADGEDFTIFVSEVYAGQLNALLIETPLVNIPIDKIKEWTCRTNDPPDEFGRISDRREIDLGFAQPGITVSPPVSSTGQRPFGGEDRGGLANNAHRLEAERAILNDFRIEVTDSQRSINFSNNFPIEGDCSR